MVFLTLSNAVWQIEFQLAVFISPHSLKFVRGHVVAIAATAGPVLLGIAAIVGIEAPVLALRGQGWSRHPTAKPGASWSLPTPTLPPLRSFFSLLPLPLSQWMALANSMACPLAGRHRSRQSLPLSTTTTQVSDDDDNDGIEDVTGTLRPPQNAANDNHDAPQSNGWRVLQTSSALFSGGIVGIIPVRCIPWRWRCSICYWRNCTAGLHENSRGGVGVVEAPIADTSLADGLFWPSSLSGICTTGAMHWRGGRAGIPLFLVVSIAMAIVQGCVFCDGRPY